MAVQSSFKLFSCVNICRNILNNSFRIAFAAPQSQTDRNYGTSKIGEDLSKFPVKPPRPLSPYFKFLADHRPLVHREHPELNGLEIVKLCAKDWKNMDEAVKDKYVETYKKEMETYAKKYLDYQAELTAEQKEILAKIQKTKSKERKKRKLKKQRKDANRPKRPQPPYILFLMEKAKEGNKSYSELIKTMGDVWKNLSESEKQKYIDQYNINVKKYQEELKSWENRMIEDGQYALVRTKALLQHGFKKSKKSSKVTKKKVETTKNTELKDDVKTK